MTGQSFFRVSAPRTGATGLNHLQSLPAAREFLRDGFDRRGPDEWLRIVIPGLEERLDGSLEAPHALEHAPPDRLAVQMAEPALDQVQPTGTCRDEVEHEARMTFEPIPHIFVLMGSVVVHDEMERNLPRELLVQSA